MSMDIKQLPPYEQDAYLSIVDGNDVTIYGKKGNVIVQRAADDKKYEVYNTKTQTTSKVFNYPIEAFNVACKIVGGFDNWQTAK